MRFIWTKRAVDLHAKGGTDPRHTVSAPNIAAVYDGFVRQLRSGTPWILVDENGTTIARGKA